jgi:hypothetical protein
MEAKIVYFESTGPDNTDETLALARQRAGELGIGTIVVATTSGSTGARAVEVFKGMKVVCVTHVFGAREPNTIELTDENRQVITGGGGIILTATHGFGGISQSVGSSARPPAPQPGGPPPGPPPVNPTTGDIVGRSLGVFGRGMKVACEIACMAADAGLVRSDEEVISIAGSSRGADLAVVLQPANAHRFFTLQVKEIICKPRL